MRRFAVPFALCLVVLGGCIAPLGGTGSPTATPTETPASAPADSLTPPERPSGATSENTVAYEDLTSTQQAAVRAAVGAEARFVPNTSYVEDSEGYPDDQIDPFRNHEYVRYDGIYYRPEFTRGRLYASYSIDASVGSPGENDTVADFEDLPADLHEDVREAIETGSYYAPAGKWDSLPAPLGETDYVRYGNQTYRMSYAVGDIWAPVMTLEAVD